MKNYKNSRKVTGELTVRDLNEKARKVLYDVLWREAKEYAETHLKGEELSYYFRTTD